MSYSAKNRCYWHDRDVSRLLWLLPKKVDIEKKIRYEILGRHRLALFTDGALFKSAEKWNFWDF